MTKKNLIIVIILLSIIDLMAAGWYVSRRIEASGKSQSLFGQRDEDEEIVMADTITSESQPDVFDKVQHNTYYFIANSPAVNGNPSSRYTSIKHVKVKWPLKVNGEDDLEELNKELIKKAFNNNLSELKEARYKYLNTPTFNKPVGDDYRSLVEAPKIVPVYGNVSQVLVYPHMTSLRLLVMEIDQVEYNGSSTFKSHAFVHYDRMNQRVLSRLDILTADVGKESKLLKLINSKIDDLNKGRGEYNQIQHAMNVPIEICCSKKGILFQFQNNTISHEPLEILIDYDKLKPFFSKKFEQLMDVNGEYSIFSEKLKPEPINETKQAPVVNKHKQPKKPSYNNFYNNNYRKSKPTQTRRKMYNGEGHKSARYNHAAKQSWRHHPR